MATYKHDYNFSAPNIKKRLKLKKPLKNIQLLKLLNSNA